MLSWVGLENAWDRADRNDWCCLVHPMQICPDQQPGFESWPHHLPTVTWVWNLTSYSAIALKMMAEALTSRACWGHHMMTEFMLSVSRNSNT